MLPYVIFNGTRSDTIDGLIITQLPYWKRAKRRYSAYDVPARHGKLYQADKPYDTFQSIMKVNFPKSAQTQVNAFFSGEGKMIASNDLGHEAYVRIYAEPQPALYRNGDIDLTITLECDPFKKIIPYAADIVKTTSGEQINNIGTAEALPKIKVEGSGYFSLTIGTQTMFFMNVDGGIIVDSEVGDAFTLDGTLLANDKIDGDLFRIQPGVSTVQWLGGGENANGDIVSGSVTRVTITPRWEDL